MKTSRPTLVVGIGASAGGSRGLKDLFSKFKVPNGMTFIVVQHLDDSGKGLAVASLKRITTLPVEDIRSGTKIKPNRVYSVAPHSLVSIKDGTFKVVPAKKTAQHLTVIDHLFTSIGKEYGVWAVGVVLSGNASDGAEGLKVINDTGGLTIVQAPSSAEHKSMPEAAIATNSVDHVVEPREIKNYILSYANFLQNVGSQKRQDALKEQILAGLTSICELLYARTRHDFKHYKTSTLMRRIQRRMQVLQLTNVADYIERLSSRHEEVETLFKELLINVTQFFRDPESFEALKQDVLAPLLKNNQTNQKIRVWVPGCSTGEEPYSIAILFRELLQGVKNPPEIQIIATDIDDAALTVARKGLYAPTIAEHVSAGRLARHFTKRSGRYSVNKELREMCLFSIHNIITDPPFSHLDLISCRNLLIYLGPHLQKKLFPVFHYALRISGYLFLGTSETLTFHKELFKSINSKHRIAQRKSTAVKIRPTNTSVQNYLNHFHVGEKVSDADIGLIGQRIALDEMPLKYAIVNDEYQIISASAGIEKYIQIPEGPFHNSIVKLTKPSLRAALRALFTAANKEKRKASSENCSLKINGKTERVGLIVQPMPQLGEESDLFWVAFQYLGIVSPLDPTADVPTAEADSVLVDQLERELSILRQELDKSVQDLEASNEELKSSNEELLSMNEELQSANEELETSKEDVQAANEALQRANLDLENLLAVTRIATLFLDNEFCIRGFTPAVQNIYRILPSDIGRSIADFTSLATKMPPFPASASIQQETLNETEVIMPDGTAYLRRIIPYQGPDHGRDGMVVTFIDITSLRNAEERRREMEKLFQVMADNAPVLIWLADQKGRYDWFNKGWLEWTGRNMDQEIGDGWAQHIHPDDTLICMQTRSGKMETRQEFYMEYRLRHRSGNYRWISDRGVPRYTPDGTFEGYIGGCVDIHEQKIGQDRLRENEKSLQLMIKTSPSFMCLLSGPQYVFEQVNDQYSKLVSYRKVLGEPLDQALPEIRNQGFIELLDSVRKTKEPFIGLEVPVMLQKNASGPTEKHYLDFVFQPHEVVDGVVQRIFVHGNDVTEKVQSRVAIENERANFRDLFKQTREMVCILGGPDHLFEFVNEAHIRVLGFDATGKTVREAQPESVEVHGILDGVYTSGKTAELHEIPVTVGKRLRYFNLTYSARRDTDGHINGVMILGSEVTDDINLQHDLEKAKSDAVRANASKTRFLANMSHEIRTPLAAIVGFGDLLRTYVSNHNEANMYVERISRNATQLGRLIDELLDLSKIEADKLELELVSFNVDTLIEDVFSTLSLKAQEKGLALKFNWLTAKPENIVSDPVRLAQILTNIVGNAVKFTEKGAINAEFCVDGQSLEVRVADTGIGLTREQQARIFEPFMQADSSVTRKYGGTGLGLALSKKLALLLGGDLTLENSTPGEGSVFKIEVAIGASVDLPKPSSLVADLPKAGSLEGKTILIVDDSEDNRVIVNLFLREFGAKIEEATNGEEAVLLATKKDFDVILMDIQMPVLDGYQALSRLKELGYSKPVIALTAHAFKAERDRCLHAGFANYITKPIHRGNLVRMICDIVKTKS